MCGNIGKIHSQGHKVAFAFLQTASVGSPDLSKDETAAIREKEARASAQIINADFFWLGTLMNFYLTAKRLGSLY
jgi:LmbE family N-acetylglucosaminyl deacetylase